MRIIGLPKSFRKAYEYAQKHHLLDQFYEQYEKPVSQWEYLRKTYRMSIKDLEKQIGISRATFYRYRRILRDIEEGKPLPSRKPRRNLKVKQWGEKEIKLVLKIRRENPTYGKFKIYHILKREYGFTMSESTVGRILSFLMETNQITKSISALKKKTSV